MALQYPPERARGRAETGGRYDHVEGWFSLGTQTPPHRHGAYFEQIYVLDGEFTVWAGGRKAVLRSGVHLTIPAGTAHVVATTGDGPGRAWSSPRRAGSPARSPRSACRTGGTGPPSAPLDMERFHRISADLGDEILGPPGAMPD